MDPPSLTLGQHWVNFWFSVGPDSLAEKSSPIAGLMLAHRLRPCPALCQHWVIAGAAACPEGCVPENKAAGRLWGDVPTRIYNSRLIHQYWSTRSRPRKLETLNQCGFNVGPASETMGQHQINIGPTSRVCWGVAGSNWASNIVILTQCRSNVGPAFATLGQHHADIGSTLRIFWASALAPAAEPCRGLIYRINRNWTTTKWINGVLGHFCAHIGCPGPREPPEDGEMKEMTLPFWHKILNSNSGGLKPSTLPMHGDSPCTIQNPSEWAEKKHLNARAGDKPASPDLTCRQL